MRLPTHDTQLLPGYIHSKSTSGHRVANVSMDKVLYGKKKNQKTFGVALRELVLQAPQGYKVPYLVKKITSHIEHHGIEYEGIFRINGSQRVVEKLRGSFDLRGDANLEEDGDIMAVAGLLKLFLRELPESAIPEYLTRRFVMTQEEKQRNTKELVIHLKTLLKSLPEEHYDLVKHIVRFLAIVACNEGVNKMSPMALAIVFGPNLFRCGKGFLALKDQGSTNQIVYRFITEYNSLFKDPNEDPPAVYWSKLKCGEIPEIHEPAEDRDHSESSSSSYRGRNSHSYNSPSFSDDEMTGRLSPFHLDSESGFSLVESPVPSARTSEFVDKAIKATVIGHLFGDESSLLNASIDTTTIRDDHTDSGKDVSTDYSPDLKRTATNVHNQVKAFEGICGQPEHTETLQKPKQQKPNSTAYDMFECKGLLIKQMHNMGKPDHIKQQEFLSEEAEFEAVPKNMDTLQTFKRAAGPENRQPPSRTIGQNSLEDDSNEEENMDEQNDIEVIPNGHVTAVIDIPRTEQIQTMMSESNSVEAKSRIAFLDIRQDNNNKMGLGTSPDKSPTGGAKPFVPPLDFSTLHQNVGGIDAIPAQKAQSITYHRAVHGDIQYEDDEDHENGIHSPRTNKVKRKAGSSVDDEDLPFSQVEQDLYKSHSHGNTDDELTTKMKSQMRKIQGLKKKIRIFEEIFEKEYGYKPSHAEKAARPEIKKHLTELSRARKEAKRLKEEAEMGNRSRHGSGASSTGERTEPPELPPSMSQTLDVILVRLRERRKEMHRPEDIELMNHEQVQEEKLAVQKALLHFEGIHGRPKTKDEKDLMRPLYDRYRTIKRLLSRQPMSPRGNLELQPVPEDALMDIQSKFADNTESSGDAIRVPTAIPDDDDDDDNHMGYLAINEFAVTQDLGIQKIRPIMVENQGPHSPKARRKLELRENNENRQTYSHSNIHDLSVPELQDELMRSRNSKKNLRKTLRDFEDSFTQRTGRKVGRDDRSPMQTEYNEYKQIKARLKLLEALLSKHQHSDV